ncbi:MAG: hypothetical protein LBG92_10165, partial [Prevotellaceae bacterium]|nr:hypothetical protein [Prevotellaceae bacterium]
RRFAHSGKFRAYAMPQATKRTSTPARMGRTKTTEAFCPFGQVPRFRKVRRQRYRSPAVMKILSFQDIFTSDSHCQ